MLNNPGANANFATFLLAAFLLTKNVAINKQIVEPLPPINAYVCTCDTLIICGIASPAL